MNISQKTKLSEEDVLLAFAIEPDHQRQTLERYLNNYPEYSLALVDLSVELKVLKSGCLEEIETLDVTADKEWQMFRNIVEEAENTKVANPLITASTEQFKKFAIKLKVNTLFLSKLRDKQIELSTIPNQFIEMCAECMNTTVELMRLFLSGEPTIASGVAFKSTVTPKTTNKITFEKAVEDSSLKAEQQAELRKLI